MLTPDVADLRLRSGRHSVTASWRAPEEAVRVEVLRACGAPPRGVGDGVAVSTDGSGFQDHTVEPGREYFYRIRVVYLTSAGLTRTSEGLVRRAAPGPGPLPVSDLAVERREGTTVVSWPSPPLGRVSVWVGPREPVWVRGARLTERDLAAFGTEAVEAPGPVAGGRIGVRVSVPPGTSHVLAVTVAGEERVAGAHRRVTEVPQVRELRAQRFGSTVRLSWSWPEHAASALVVWGPSGPDHGDGDEGAGGRSFCSRRRYEREGGFEAAMGPGSVEVSVCTVVPDGAGEAMSVPVRARVPGAVVVAYRVEPVGWWRRERTVHLTAETSGEVPEIAVVHAQGRVQPHSVTQGQVLATFPAGHRRAGEHTQVQVRPPQGSGPGWLMCFLVSEAEGADRVRLRQPSVRELRL